MLKSPGSNQAINRSLNLYLAGDIGATKTHLAIFSSEKGPRVPVADAMFPSADYPSLEAIVKKFLEQTRVTADKAGFAVAGPVVGGRAKLTNLPWVIAEDELRRKLDLSSVLLMNDLVAIATSIPHLRKKDLHTLNEGEAIEGGAIAVIAPGTGLGEAFLTWDGTHYRAYPSEGGHADFAPNNETEAGLLKFLQDRLGHVSYDWICSGRGIPNIYEFLKESKHAEEPERLAEEIARADDPAPVITAAGIDKEKGSELCAAAMNTFVSILGAEAGNMALSVLATGGVYLGGGIPPRILPILESGLFVDAFTNKGRMSSLLTGIPVRVITNPNSALLGAAYTLMED